MRGLPVGLPLSIALWSMMFGQWRYALAFACMAISVQFFRAFYQSVLGANHV